MPGPFRGSQRRVVRGGEDQARHRSVSFAWSLALRPRGVDGGSDVARPTVGRDRELDQGAELDAWLQKRCFWIFPTDVRGKLSRNSIASGTLKADRCARHHAMSSSAVARPPSFTMTYALIAWSRTGSGTPTTAASKTPGCCLRVSSTSEAETFSPARLIMSFLRSTKKK